MSSVRRRSTYYKEKHSYMQIFLISYVHMNTNSDSILVGVAGEYSVAGELSRKGYVATITLRNSKGIDIV